MRVNHGILALAATASLCAATPGKVDFTNCDAGKASSHLDAVIVDPYPPTGGQDLHIELQGTLSKPIDGGELKVTGKAGIFGSTKTFNLCEFIEKGNQHCPVSAGAMNFKGVFPMPAELKGKVLDVTLRGENNDALYFCVEAKLKFN
ncbi:hypothetical protein GQ42DRAFT_22949 [Ramicandelaber brevisporus]|nr:hypothetical protein GQ42DRAFT_22949 [Ramicandelaber brevisporus]